jgi:hypothetical protein
MTRKKMEGDEERRRQKARAARAHGERPSAESATTRASKQRRHVSSDAEPHAAKVEKLREGKQPVIAQKTPRPRPHSR